MKQANKGIFHAIARGVGAAALGLAAVAYAAEAPKETVKIGVLHSLSGTMAISEVSLRDVVSAVFGCWTSVSRKSVLPVFEGNNGLLFYPVQYEGEECSNNVFYSGATPNQQLIPSAEYLMS